VSKFRVGDVVVCVDAECSPLVEGEVYEVLSMEILNRHSFVRVEGVGPSRDQQWRPDRFARLGDVR
jgi:hypothetical protein